MVKLEVRCCCQPHKLLGWLQVPDHSGYEVRYMIRAPADIAGEGEPTVFGLPIERIGIHGRSYRAVKAEGMTVEQLRKIPGFEEAPETV